MYGGGFNQDFQFTKNYEETKNELIYKIDTSKIGKGKYFMKTGNKHNLILLNGDVFGWGNNNFNQINPENYPIISDPTKIDFFSHFGKVKIVTISAGGFKFQKYFFLFLDIFYFLFLFVFI